MTDRSATTRGFARAATLLQSRIRRAGEVRGFAVSRLLTRWEEIAGADMAAIARPVKVSYAQGGFGATLTLLTTGAHAPVLEMQKERLRTRVNAAYGYNAIARLRITQTAPEGFAEAQAGYVAPKRPPAAPDPLTEREAERLAAAVADEGLRDALETLARNVLSRERAGRRP